MKECGEILNCAKIKIALLYYLSRRLLRPLTFTLNYTWR